LELALQSLLGLRQGVDLDDALNECHKLLRNDGLQLPDSAWSRLSRPHLLQTLIDMGAPIGKSFWGDNAIVFLMWNMGHYRSDFLTVVDMLSSLIKHGVGINNLGVDGVTPSKIARYMRIWAEWCGALERNGLQIEDVLEKEGNTWLLEDDWRKLWIEWQYEEWEYLEETARYKILLPNSA
jgi:hypothetical protein